MDVKPPIPDVGPIKIDRREVQIFLTVLLIVGLFAQVYGQNADSRIDLTRSIVERGSLDITPYRNNTADRSFYKGEYYSDKAPGLSFAAVPIYWGWRSIYSMAGDTDIHDDKRKIISQVRNTKLSVATDPGSFYLSALIVMVLLASTAPFALLTVLLYRFSSTILEREWLRLLAVFGFAFGTPMTHYGAQFLPNTLAALLSFSSFYTVYMCGEDSSTYRMLLAGTLGGLAVTVQSLNAILLAGIFIYSWWKFQRFPKWFFTGGFIGGLPYMVYNTVVFGAPWKLPRNFLDPAFWPFLQTTSGFILDPVRSFFVSLRLLFLPYRGIFYWSPFLFLSIPGSVELYRKNRSLFHLIAGTFLLGTIVVSLWWAWWHGGFFGPRHMTFLIPFLMLPVMYCMKEIVEMEKKWILIVFLVLSVSINIIGTYGSYENMLIRDASQRPGVNEIAAKTGDYNEINPTVFQMKPRYFEAVKSFRVMANPLSDRYLSGFREYGPQSHLLTGTYHGEIPPDIRAYSRDLEDERPPVLILSGIILGVIIVIWREEIRDYMLPQTTELLENLKNRKYHARKLNDVNSTNQ